MDPGSRQNLVLILAGLLGCVAMSALWLGRQQIAAALAPRSALVVEPAPRLPAGTGTQLSDVRQRLAAAALAQVGVTLTYDPAYVRLAYPGGDVPAERGVCSDVIVRAFRGVGWDLQRALHDDMAASFGRYPTRWGLLRPDPNIDHRRVLNLMTWFERQGWSVPISHELGDFEAGDVVAWDLGGGITHIGLVAPELHGRLQIVHNIGQGARQESVLFSWTMIGHYRVGADRPVLSRR